MSGENETDFCAETLAMTKKHVKLVLKSHRVVMEISHRII